MADQNGPARDPVAIPPGMAESGERYTLFAALRWLEAMHPEQPRLGRSQRAGDESVRVAQIPSLRFAPGELTRIESRHRVHVHGEGFGLFGPNGPLPIHLTEYADQRLRQEQDPTFTDFLNIFHHRIASLFFRAWADAEPTVEADRPDDRFLLYVGALIGLGPPSLRDRDTVGDLAKLHRAGRFSGTRSRESLEDILADHLGLKVQILPFQPAWLEIPEGERLRLSRGNGARRLGRDANLGGRSWQCQFGFRVVLLDLTRSRFLDLLPGAPALTEIGDLIRFFIGDELRWDLELQLAPRQAPPLRLARGTRLGWSTWLGRGPQRVARSRIRDTHTWRRHAAKLPRHQPGENHHG